MKRQIIFMVFAFLAFTLISCNNLNNQEQKKLLLSEKEMNLKASEAPKKEISIKDAVKLAEKKFNKYLPNILTAHDANLDLQRSYTGDFTGDGIEDIAIYFSLASVDGGNAIVWQGLTLYRNDGYDVKVIAGYEPDYLFGFDKISNGKIYVEKLDYAEGDGRCCPSIKITHALTISGSKAY